MKTSSIWALLPIMFWGLACAEEGEPSDAEMLAAIRQHYDAANAQMQELQRRCAYREYSNHHNPALVVQCLSVTGIAGSDEGLELQIGRFEKIACAKAEGQPGHVCDYFIVLSSGNPLMGRGMGDLMRQGDHAQGRFIKRQDTWLFLPR
ncbi:hypothetical protein [Zestomonas carbonaria]|uniref:Nuclear transport factor 2 family protein n=1 Tax=Zestomonas carbonaria TaxID=2762745 RepID=A0A7U7I8Q4_9GAMM|nr:hypothetical protein [Pseudomonas carbonaria]CAD5107574.1 hypothetical protein PSEWESI4_01847 [Pseudomonas carbonaria]